MSVSDIDSEDPIVDINLTPLVDVSLVLVIIFMVVAPFCSNVIKPMTLPSSRKSSLYAQDSIKVSLFPDGNLAVGPEFIPRERLVETLRGELASGKPSVALVRAGTDVPHGEVMEVLHAVKQAGVQRIAFAVHPKSEGGPLP